MARKTLTQEVKELKAEQKRTERSYNALVAEKNRLRDEVLELQKPTTKEEEAKLARKQLRDLGRIEAILAEWNWVGQTNLVRRLKEVYQHIGNI